ncbi:MAG: RepB family plasmid replication initiator protein [Metamycoplasmataceae bacterium]
MPYIFFDKLVSSDSPNTLEYWDEVAAKAVSISAILPKLDENGQAVDSYMPVFQRIDNGIGARYIEVKLNQEFIPHYSKLTSNYVQTKLSEIKNFKSKYSLRIYEYLIASSPNSKILNLKMDMPYFLRHFNIPKRYGFVSKLKPLIIEPTILDLRSTTRFKNIDIELEKKSRCFRKKNHNSSF